MKFETKLGLGEVAITKAHNKARVYEDAIVEIIGIHFDRDKNVTYIVRYSNGNVSTFKESELIGDPDFDQETGTYKTSCGGCEEQNANNPGTVDAI